MDEKKEGFTTKVRSLWTGTSIKQKIGVLSFMAVLIALCISTVVSVMIDPETFKSEEGIYAWLVRSAFLGAIATYGILDGLNVTMDSAMKKSNGLYQATLTKYRSICAEAQRLGSFAEWYVGFVAMERRRVLIDYLFENGIKDAEKFFDNIKDIDLKSLEGTLTEEQLEAVKNVKEGRIKVKAPEWSYYLSKSIEGGKARSVVEVGYHLDKVEKTELYGMVALKIAWNVLSRTALAVLTVGDIMKLNNWQSWFDLVMRIFVLVSAFYSGSKSGMQVVSTRTMKLENKIQVISKYIEDLNKGRFIERSLE